MRSKLLVFKNAKSLILLITGRNASPRHHCSRYCQVPFTLWSGQSRLLQVSKLSANRFSQSRFGPLLPARYRIKRQFHGRTSQLRHQLSFGRVLPIENVATDKRRPLPRVTLERRSNHIESCIMSRTLRTSFELWEEGHGKRKPASPIWALSASRKSNSVGEHNLNCRNNCNTHFQSRDILPVLSFLAFGHTKESRNDSVPKPNCEEDVLLKMNAARVYM